MNSRLITKKRTGIPLILLAAAAAVVVSILFFQYFSQFNEQNLKAIHIKLAQENPNAVADQEYFLLSSEDRIQLAIALDNVSSLEFEQEIWQEKISHQYNLVLHNSFGFSREYQILFVDNEIFLKDLQSNQSVVKVEETDFFFSHPGFYHIYSDRLEPVLQVTLNDYQVLYSNLDRQWSYLRYDGQWNTQVLELKNKVESNINATALSSDDKLAVVTDRDPDYAYLKIIELATDRVVFHGEVDDLSRLPFPNVNGIFEYQLTMDWLNEIRPYRGQAIINIPVELNFPEKFVFSKQRIIQGELLEVSVYNVENIEDLFFEQSLYEGFNWYDQDGLIRGYLPTNYSINPGVYEIKYGNREKGIELIQEIEVIAHNYRIQQLTIDTQVAESTRNDAAYAEFAKYFTPVRQQSAPTRYYSEPFILPTKGRLTTEFGQTRYINGAPTSYRHSGLDIAAPTGTEVKAGNRGKVVLAMPLILTGNSIVIDHGEGLFSVYYHMHENLVSTGEIVERGQIIATVGTTGFSTGPHLHFTMSYYMMNIEPGFFIVGEPITNANYREFMQD